MNLIQNINHQNSQYLLALHSSSDSLGVAVLDLLNPETSKKIETFTIGRKLSNQLFASVEKVLKRSSWQNIKRLAVATGPGSFTGTRLTIAMARIMAQQLNCSLDSFSSFKLMASRLSLLQSTEARYKPFWIKDNLTRRGIIAGKYQVRKKLPGLGCADVIELKPPHLLVQGEEVFPSIDASDDVKNDVNKLLDYSFSEQINGKKNRWENVLPIYLTSPLDNKLKLH